MRQQGCTVKTWRGQRCLLQSAPSQVPPASHSGRSLSISTSQWKTAAFRYLRTMPSSVGSFFPWPNWAISILIKGFLHGWPGEGTETTKCHWLNKAWIWGERHLYPFPSQLLSKNMENKPTSKDKKGWAWRHVPDPNLTWIYGSSWFSHGSRFLNWNS